MGVSVIKLQVQYFVQQGPCTFVLSTRIGGKYRLAHSAEAYYRNQTQGIVDSGLVCTTLVHTCVSKQRKWLDGCRFLRSGVSFAVSGSPDHL